MSKIGPAAVLSTLLLCLLVGPRYPALARDIASSTVSDFPAANLTIFSADGKQVIGYGTYAVTATDDEETLRGENRYLDGEYDTELEHLKSGVGGQPPTLVSYEHSFFNTDHSPQRVASLDTKSGAASCKVYLYSQPEDRRSHVTVPADTYAGATQMMFVVIRLRQGADNIRFHSFSCTPGPEVIATEASVEPKRVRWSMYPGELVKLEMGPDLGWLGVLAAPFIRKMYAWVDPNNNRNFVGGVYDRFYGGRRVLTVRGSQHLQPRY